MILSLPLLALALRRRMRAEAVVRERLECEEAAELTTRWDDRWDDPGTDAAPNDAAADAAGANDADGGPASAPEQERPAGPGAGS
jgi:hypothetical protein